ncbi:hypothetical protein [Staphylococcus saprophyticus]|uniref:hypothetical protein n=1 Tax=Staphylococcus saprophyticus TaxID=29385 RepID=UPI00384A5B9B
MNKIKIRNLNIQDSFKIQGIFCLDEVEYYGVFSSDGFNFHLDFITDKWDLPENINEIEFLASNGEKLFLYNGICEKSKINLPGFSEYTFLFSQFWVTQNQNVLDNFSSVSIDFSGLKQIVNFSPYTIKKYTTKSIYEITRSTNNFKILLPEKNGITLKLMHHYKYTSNDYREMQFTYENFLKIQYSKPVNAKTCINNILDINYLFSFITNEKHKTKKVILGSGDHLYYIFISSPFEFKEKHKKSILPITNDFYEKYFYKIYNFYLENNKLFEDIFYLYVNIMYEKKFVNHYLLNLLKINEGLFNRFIRDDNTNLKQKYKELLHSLDIELQNYLKSLIDYNERELNNFLKDFRHYHSHYFTKSKSLSYKYESDFKVANYVLQLHKAFIFKEVGVNEKDIISLLKYTH